MGPRGGVSPPTRTVVRTEDTSGLIDASGDTFRSRRDSIRLPTPSRPLRLTGTFTMRSGLTIPRRVVVVACVDVSDATLGGDATRGKALPTTTTLPEVAPPSCRRRDLVTWGPPGEDRLVTAALLALAPEDDSDERPGLDTRSTPSRR